MDLPSPIRILLADDHVIFREGLHQLLEKEGLAVVGEASDGYEAIELVRATTPHMVIMDLSMPRMNGIEATRRIKEEFPSVKVIGLSMHAVQRLIQEMLIAGGSGYLLKDCESTELMGALHHVMKGNVYLTPSVTTMVVSDYIAAVDSQNAGNPFAQLTKREREVLQLLAEGVSTKEIASSLSISVKTAHAHRQNIMTKLKINSVAELTRYALREGLTQL